MDITVIGHFSIDTIFLPSISNSYVGLGGSAAYFSLIASILNAKISVISKIGEDFPQYYLDCIKNNNVGTDCIKKISHAKTTKFELKYDKNLNRILRLINKAPVINPVDIPKSLQTKVIHLAPIVNEVSYELVEYLTNFCDFLSIDPQGMLRNFDKNGNVIHSSLINNSLFRLINIYKSSIEEIFVVTGSPNLDLAIKFLHDLGVKIVIVTLGSKGALLSDGNHMYSIPPYFSQKCVDPTGAGDVFIGAFLTEYTRRKDLEWCGCVGCAASSTVIEGIGTTFLGDEAEIYRRANLIYEKEISNRL